MRRFDRDLASTSGGTAFTVHRAACHVFENIPKATRILYISTIKRLPDRRICGTVLFLVEIAHLWWDIGMNRCEINSL
jgi:hypothetical protein